MTRQKKESVLNHAHQQNLFDPRHARKLFLIGAGGVNSWVGEFSGRAGITEIEAWDHDIVKSHNLPMSCYLRKHIGMYKVDALAQILHDHFDIDIIVHRERYCGQKDLHGGAVACGVDVMERELEDGIWVEGGRKHVWENVLNNKGRVDIFTDTRLLGAYVEVLAIDPKVEEERILYKDLFFDDGDAARQTCGNHGIVYSTTSAANAVVANITQFWEHSTKKLRHRVRTDILLEV